MIADFERFANQVLNPNSFASSKSPNPGTQKDKGESPNPLSCEISDT